jgi:Zn-dependent protease
MISFRLGPFPIVIYPVFFLGAALLGYEFGLGWQMLVWIAVVFASVLIHELGHAVVGKLLGGQPEIHLQMLGGVTFPRLRKRPRPLQQFVLSLAGPAAGMFLGGLAWLVTRAMPPEPGSPTWLAMDMVRFCSFVWAGFNLLPILPLDGGQMMEAIIEGVRRKPSEALAARISVVFAFGAAAACFVFYGMTQPFLLGWFVLFAFDNLRRASAARGQAPRAPGAARVDALELADIERATADARSALAQRDFEAALRAASELDAGGGPFRQAAALRLRGGIELSRGDNEAAALLAGQSFSIVQNADSAVVAARANLRLGQPERALNWLRRAVEAGAPPAAIQADPELSALGR